MSTSLTERLRASSQPTWDALISNPFVTEMADGSLSVEKFRFYVEQNLFYLPQYAKVLGFGLARSNSPAEVTRFARSVHQIVDVEIETNRRLLDRIVALGAEDQSGSVEPSPTCFAYTNYLLAVAATGSSAETMAAMLPCAWSYGDMATRHQNCAPHPVYSEWLSFFGDEDYIEYVDSLLAEFDGIIGEVTNTEAARLERRFLAGARYESAFWNMAYTFEQWPDD
ncbi:MAG: thiaminase II [Acidimicrobiales bacterium]|nr:thiaminase II [Acidimicrobiales bacterium]